MTEVTARILEIFDGSVTPYTRMFHISVIQKIYKDGQYSRESRALIYFPHYFSFNRVEYNTRTKEIDYG